MLLPISVTVAVCKVTAGAAQLTCQNKLNGAAAACGIAGLSAIVFLFFSFSWRGNIDLCFKPRFYFASLFLFVSSRRESLPPLKHHCHHSLPSLYTTHYTRLAAHDSPASKPRKKALPVHTNSPIVITPRLEKHAFFSFALPSRFLFFSRSSLLLLCMYCLHSSSAYGQVTSPSLSPTTMNSSRVERPRRNATNTPCNCPQTSPLSIICLLSHGLIRNPHNTHEPS